MLRDLIQRGVITTSLLLGMAGCSKLVPVQGKVTMDGKPLAEATVSFVPLKEDGTMHPVSITDSDGNFSLVGREKPGALPGKYKVIVSKNVYLLPRPGERRPSKTVQELMEQRPELQGVPMFGGATFEMVAKAYTTKQTTPLEIEVPKGGKKDIEISVKSSRR